jgi:tetratricopeptide (TPR) repeat protein
MAESNPSRLPRLTAEQRRAAAGQFERANQVIAGGDFDYGLQLLFNCCQIDPANRIYRQALRSTQKAKYSNNQKGQSLASVRTLRGKMRLRKAILQKDHLQALKDAELVLMRNPWDLSTNLLMSQAFDELGLIDLAVWTLEQIRPDYPHDPHLNRPLARLYEKRGQFGQAIALWDLIRKAVPTDLEAQHKVKDLAASATIAKGKYAQAVEGSAPTPLVGNQVDAKPAAGAAGADGKSVVDTKTHEALVRETQTAQPALPVSGDGVPAISREVATLLGRIQANPGNANAYLHLASYYRRNEQPDKARETLQSGMQPTNNSFELAQELLDLDIDPLRHDLAVAEDRLRKQPGNADLQRIRAGLAKEINTRELEYFRRRADRYPTDTLARFEMGTRLVRGGQIDEAIRELQGIRNDPRYHGKVLFYLATCFKARKNWRLAQRNFEEAIPHLKEEDDALYKEALYQLAVGCADAGDLEHAVETACELVNLDFGYKNISELLDTWQAKVS